MSEHQTRKAKYRRIQDLYDRVPLILCQGKCQAACTSRIIATSLEVRTIHYRHGDPPVMRRNKCPYLTEEGRCGIYDMRPLICRLYGVVDTPLMRCEHGCAPVRWLTDDQSRKLIYEAQEISGGKHEFLSGLYSWP